MPRLAFYAAVVSVLSATAAALSFARGAWAVAIVWILLTGLTSNMAWYWHRRPARGRILRAAGPGGPRARDEPGLVPDAALAGCTGAGACGVCVKRIC
ncbi:hypothetical protein ACWGI9_11220 [Streptomyces sp. NPDC054833]